MSTKSGKKYRKFWNHLTIEDYLRLELVAHQKGLTPYQVSSQVVSAWLHGELVPRKATPSPSPSVAGTDLDGESEAGEGKERSSDSA